MRVESEVLHLEAKNVSSSAAIVAAILFIASKLD